MNPSTSLLSAVAVLAASAAAAAPALAHPVPGARSVPAAHLVDCAGHSLVAPREFDLFCGDGGDLLSDLTWTQWGAAEATATGTETMNECTPDCAAGHYSHHRVTLTVSGLAGGRYHDLRVDTERFDLTARGPVLA